MKTLNKPHENKNNFKGWTHFYEDGPLIQNETIDEEYIVSITVLYKNELQFKITLQDKNYETLFEYLSTDMELEQLNNHLQTINPDLKTELTIDEYFELIHQETI